MSEFIIECNYTYTDRNGKPCEEIVRCRDCIYYKPDSDPIDPGWPMMCERTGDDMVEPYGFCAWGERKSAEGICYIVETHYDEKWESRYWLLSCGHCVWGEVPTKFCPECGAKVVIDQ